MAMDDYIKEALTAGYIRPLTSSATAGFFFVEKRDGRLRLCIDYLIDYVTRTHFH